MKLTYKWTKTLYRLHNYLLFKYLKKIFKEISDNFWHILIMRLWRRSKACWPMWKHADKVKWDTMTRNIEK